MSENKDLNLQEIRKKINSIIKRSVLDSADGEIQEKSKESTNTEENISMGMLSQDAENIESKPMITPI